MGSKELSKRGTDRTRENIHQRWLGPFDEVIPATADSARQGAEYDCFGLPLLIQYLLDVDSTVHARESAGTYYTTLYRPTVIVGQRGMKEKVSLVVGSLAQAQHPE